MQTKLQIIWRCSTVLTYNLYICYDSYNTENRIQHSSEFLLSLGCGTLSKLPRQKIGFNYFSGGRTVSKSAGSSSCKTSSSVQTMLPTATVYLRNAPFTQYPILYLIIWMITSQVHLPMYIQTVITLNLYLLRPFTTVITSSNNLNQRALLSAPITYNVSIAVG